MQALFDNQQSIDNNSGTKKKLYDAPELVNLESPEVLANSGNGNDGGGPLNSSAS